MKIYNVVSFSGGKDSTALLLMMIEKKMQIDSIIYLDTTWDTPEIYEHNEKVKKYILPYTITTIKLNFDYYFAKERRLSGRHTKKKGRGWPNQNFR